MNQGSFSLAVNIGMLKLCKTQQPLALAGLAASCLSPGHSTLLKTPALQSF